MLPAELALRVEDVSVEPDVGVGEAVGTGTGVGQEREGLAGFACRRGHQGKAAGGYPFPAGIAEPARPGEGLLKKCRGPGWVGPGQLDLPLECLRHGKNASQWSRWASLMDASS